MDDTIIDITKFKEMFGPDSGAEQPGYIKTRPLPDFPMWCLVDGVRMNPVRLWGMHACPDAFKAKI